jgi:two-component system, cell cycle sensor histidine kinase and response regulator CckA
MLDDRFRKVFEEAPVGMATFGPDLRLVDTNAVFERMVGSYKEALAGAGSVDLIVEADRAEWLHEGRRLFAGEIPAFRMERRYTARDGAIVWADVTATVIRGADGQPLGLAVVQDITERRSLEEQLRQSQKMEAIGRLAGGVAHDFNNLLSVISGYGELLVADLSLGEQSRMRVEQMLRAADRAGSLTRQLLAFGRKQVVEPRVLDLNAVLLDADRFLRRLIGEDVEIMTSLGAGIGSIRADRGQLEQILMNLVVNARDAMPRGGTITLRTADVEIDGADPLLDGAMPSGRYVMLAVEDTGVGMSREVQARIFEPFFTTKERGRGTGLGLATVHGIVEQSHGHIFVSSEPGRGTTFRVYLPRVEEAAAESAPAARARRGAHGSETILIVEDEPAVRELVAEALHGFGYQVLTASTFDGALDATLGHTGPIDLLVTDVILPGRGGVDVARAIRGLRPDIAVLYASGYTDDAVLGLGIENPGVAFLQKPFTLAALADKIREVLASRPHARRAPIRRRERARRRGRDETVSS